MSHPWLRLCCRLGYDRPFREALAAYEWAFQELLAEMHGDDVPAASRLAIDLAWDPRGHTFNAVARRPLLGRRSVTLGLACWDDLQWMASTVFASRDQFASVGDPARESRTFADWFNADASSGVGASVPACPVRREAAFLTTELGLILIMLHEVGHHALGHLGVGRGWPWGVRALHESLDRPASASKPTKPGKATASHARELRADRFAFAYLATLAAAGRTPFDKQLVGFAELRPALFEVAVLAFVLVVLFLGGFEHPIGHYDALGHPHPLVRLTAGVAALGQTLPGADPDRVQRALGEAIRFLAASEDGANVLTLLAGSRDEIADQVARLGDPALAGAGSQTYDFRAGVWSFRDPA